jgi:hypothetical protein
VLGVAMLFQTFRQSQFGFMELGSGPLKSRLERVGLMARGFARWGMLFMLLFRGYPRFTENKAHSTVWTVYGAFVTLLPLCLLTRMNFLHAMQSGFVVWFAAACTPTSVLRWFIEQGAAVNGAESPLAIAVLHRSASKVAVLLAAGAEVNARCFGESPLSTICSHSAWHGAFYPVVVSIAEMLLDAGADVNARNCYNETLLFNIIRKPYVDGTDPTAIVHLLLDAGATALFEGYPNVSPLNFTRSSNSRGADMFLGVIAYQAHLAQHAMPMIESPERRLLVSPFLEILRERKVLVHAHAAMRRQAWSRRRRAVACIILMNNKRCKQPA